MYAYIRTRTPARMHRPIFTYASPSPQACAPTRTCARSRTPSHVHPHTRARKYVRPQGRSHQHANKMSPYCAFQRFFLFRNEARNAGCLSKYGNAGNTPKCVISRTIAGRLTHMGELHAIRIYAQPRSRGAAG